METDLKDVEQEVVSYRESVAEVPNQICFAMSPNKVKVGKALAQQADGLQKLSKYEVHGEHVTVGCGELHVADVSNQIGLAKSPYKGKGGKALVTATGLREGLEESCPSLFEAAGTAGSAAAAAAGDAAHAEGGPRCGQAQQVETGFFDFEVEQVQAFEAGRGPAECMREDFKEQPGLLTQVSWGLESAGLKQQQRQRGKRNPRVRLVAAASGEAVEAGTARGAAAPTERQTLFVRIAQQPPVRWIHVFGVLLCLLLVPCGMEVGSHAELVVEELVKPWVEPAKAVRAFGVETQVPGVVLAEFSRGQGVGAVPAKKAANKAKSKKAATKASKKGGQVVWSADDHQYNQLYMARGADFLSSDRDGDGSISFSELRLASGRISASTFRFKKVEEVFRLVDVDKDGVLGVTEYLNAISWLDTAGD